MSDIHLLEGNVSHDSGDDTVTVIYHVPNDKSQNKYPGSNKTCVPNLSNGELDALVKGDLIEVCEQVKMNINEARRHIQEIREKWQEKANKSQHDLNLKYKFYGIELDRM